MARRAKGLSFYQKKERLPVQVIREIISVLIGILIAIFLALFFAYFLGLSTNAVGSSMEPTVMNGQQVLINRLSYMVSSPKEGDVVVFLPNGNTNSHYYIKRIIAEPGDHVIIKDGIIFVNGIESTYVTELISDPGIAETEITLDAGYYFLLGDNPNTSEDSRSPNIGAVHQDDMIGKVWFRLRLDESSMGFVN